MLGEFSTLQPRRRMGYAATFGKAVCCQRPALVRLSDLPGTDQPLAGVVSEFDRNKTPERLLTTVTKIKAIETHSRCLMSVCAQFDE